MNILLSNAIVAMLLGSFLLSWLLTRLMISLSPRIGFVDHPFGRKVHQTPKPLGGGVAITWAMLLPMIAALAWVWLVAPAHHPLADYIGGLRRETPLLLGIITATLTTHVMGLIDDRKALGPYLKMLVQLAVAAMLVFTCGLVALPQLGWLSPVLTILWLVAISNAFNFLDNMDGLSAGVAAVCAAAFLVATLQIGQWFVAGGLALLLGALLGFLWFNFPPARIFMGDSGSLVVGLTMGILTVRTTFVESPAMWGAGWYAVFTPVIVLALPLYDLVVVSIIRLLKGKSPFIGDTNHFSHRLVARGMSKRTAVLCLYLVSAATAVAAIVLPQVRTPFAAMLIFGQTLLILGVVALLEQHPMPRPPIQPPN